MAYLGWTSESQFACQNVGSPCVRARFAYILPMPRRKVKPQYVWIPTLRRNSTMIVSMTGFAAVADGAARAQRSRSSCAPSTTATSTSSPHARRAARARAGAARGGSAATLTRGKVDCRVTLTPRQRQRAALAVDPMRVGRARRRRGRGARSACPDARAAVASPRCCAGPACSPSASRRGRGAGARS